MDALTKALQNKIVNLAEAGHLFDTVIQKALETAERLVTSAVILEKVMFKSSIINGQSIRGKQRQTCLVCGDDSQKIRVEAIDNDAHLMSLSVFKAQNQNISKSVQNCLPKYDRRRCFDYLNFQNQMI